MNYKQMAKEFAVTYGVKLSDKRYAEFVHSLAKLLEQIHKQGISQGEAKQLCGDRS